MRLEKWSECLCEACAGKKIVLDSNESCRMERHSLVEK